MKKRRVLETPFVTIKAASELLHVSEGTIHNYLRQGILKALRIPQRGRILIPKEEIAAFLQPIEIAENM